MKVYEFFILLLVAVAVCGFCFDYTLDTCIGKDVPWYIDCVAGAVIGPITVTICVICWVVESCDVETPFFKLEE